MVVEIINVGTELLRGCTINTNAAYLAEECTKLGFPTAYQSVVGDEEKALMDALGTAVGRSDVVILTGGLGKDDLTKEVLAGYMGRKLSEDKRARADMKELFKKRGIENIPASNLKQALVIEGSTVLYNRNGTAPGMIVKADGGKCFVLLPGPPNELVPMFEEGVAPYLRKMGKGASVTKTVKVCGIGESMVESEIIHLLKDKKGPLVTTYAKSGEVHVHVTARAENGKDAEKAVKPVVKEIVKHFGDKVYSLDGNETLEESVIKHLGKKKLTLVTAESCTGGLLAGRLVNVPGASKVFQQGFVTYSNKAKRKTLEVSKDTLKKYGAVSRQTAKEMAKHAAIGHNSDVAVAITGIAGPGAEDTGKPIGTTYIACYYNGGTEVKEYLFAGDRAKIRAEAVTAALCLLREVVKV